MDVREIIPVTIPKKAFAGGWTTVKRYAVTVILHQKKSEETLHRVNDLPNWKVPIFKDYNGLEYNHYSNLGPGYESRIICPCCGFCPSTDDYNSILEIGKNECKNCGSVYTVEEIQYFIIKCKKYRTDGE